MINYVGFALAVVMLTVSLSANSFGWAAGWVLLMWLNASSIAEDIQLRETIAKVPDELKAKLYAAIAIASSK